MLTCLALDIGGTKIAAALVRDGQIQSRKQVDTPASQEPKLLTDTLQRLISPWKESADFVAVASTGIIAKSQ